MNHLTRTLINTTLAGFLTLLVGACATPYHLNVKYDLPQAPDQLQGQKVKLVIEDQREKKVFFSEKAKNDFDMWDGTFSLIIEEEQPAEPVQTHDLPALFREAMKKRLQAMQIEVVEASADNVPTLAVTIEKFMIDLKGRTWHSHIVYKAQLSRDNMKIAKETVSGKAERTKVMGKGGGEKLIGEMFSEGINNLDIPKLFKNAGIL